MNNELDRSADQKKGTDAQQAQRDAERGNQKSAGSSTEGPDLS